VPRQTLCDLGKIVFNEELAAGHRIKQAALHPGAFEHATTHQQFDIALYFV